MSRRTHKPSPRARFAADEEAAMNEKMEYALGKLRTQTVLISKCIDEEEQGPQKVLESLRGTGILVRNLDSPGILTAGHVVRDLTCGEQSTGKVMMAIDQSLKPMTMSAQPHCRVKIQGWIIQGEGRCKSHEDPLETQLKDPDIVWIRITEEDARILGPEGYVGGIFHNWQQSEKTRDEEMRKQGHQETGLWVCGGVREKSTKLLEKEGEASICGLMIQVCREGPVTKPPDGWDRFDYTLQPSDSPATGDSDKGNCKVPSNREKILHERPTSWGGLSGAGIWDVRCAEGQANMRPNCSLVGVVYAEHPINSNEPDKLRGHGIGSINRVLGCA